MAQMRVTQLPGKSPLITFRIVFTTGSAADPAEKPGLAYLTAHMLAEGGTRSLTYRQIVDATFPMAASIGVEVDKEMSTFHGATHSDNLDAYYKLVRAMLLEPGWREDDLRRNCGNRIVIVLAQCAEIHLSESVALDDAAVSQDPLSALD